MPPCLRQPRRARPRAACALSLAASGRQVVVVSGGDPGVFAMAAAVFEAVETGEPAWRELDIRVEPGVTAMLAAAAEVGAPLGGDFCAISLSDNLKAWSTVERRLKAAAEGDFVIALYNPASKARPTSSARRSTCCARSRPPTRRCCSCAPRERPMPRSIATTLGAADPSRADMRTLVIVGASTTRQVGRWVCTPRSRGGALVSQPRHSFLGRPDDVAGGFHGACDHDHGQAKHARRLDLGVGGAAARVARNDHVDLVLLQAGAARRRNRTARAAAAGRDCAAARPPAGSMRRAT